MPRSYPGPVTRRPLPVPLVDSHQRRVRDLRIARQPVGYLINFGHKGELEWKRFILSDLHETPGVNLHELRISAD